MRYVLRADASQSIGSGHVMRSTAIAEELITRGKEVVFVGEFSDVPWLALRINTLGFSAIFNDAASFIANSKTDVLILDSYTLSIDDEFIQQRNWKAVVTIIDEFTPGYLADLMIHPGLSVDWKPVSGTKVLAGPNYIPFRKSIKKNNASKHNVGVLEILVTGGGADTFNFVEAVCAALKKTTFDYRARIFTNNFELAELDSRFAVVPIGSELDVFAKSAMLIFTTASTTSLEFVAREVAVGIGCAVNNQEAYYETLSSAGVAYPIGRFIQSNWEINETNVVQLVQSSELRESLRKNCANLIDLEGASRIADEILNL